MKPSSTELDPGTPVAGRYEIASLVDQTPLGALYRGTKLAGGQPVFILVLDHKLVVTAGQAAVEDRFRALRELHTRRSLTAIELAAHKDTQAVIFEGTDAPTLRDVLARRRKASDPFSLQEAAQIVQQVLEVAAALHAGGFVARAIRPEYVFLSSKTVGPKASNVIIETWFLGGPLWDLIDPGTLAEDEYNRDCGQYLAPELRGIDPQISPRADIYSAGAIFYELLVGEAPSGTYQLPKSRRPDLPTEVNTIAEIALAIAPEDRYPTTQDFVAGIQRTFTVREDTDGPQRSNPLIWGAAVFVVVAIAAVLFNPMRKSPEQIAIDNDTLLIKEVRDAQVSLPPDAVRTLLEQNPNMVYIPAGPFVHGTLNVERLRNPSLDTTPPVTQTLPGYLIDALEYPNQKDAEPQHGVTWTDAFETCESEGKRLCSIEELEKACRGRDNSPYAYGAEYDPDTCGAGVHPSASKESCKTDQGVYDLNDNYREWSSSPQGAQRRLVIGGLTAAERTTRCTYATDLSESYTDATISFRCCKDIE